MRLWAATNSDGHAPFRNHQDMLSKIDAIDLADIPWQSFSAKYSGEVPLADPPDWMLKDYTVYYRDPLSVIRSMIANPAFKGQFDYAPFRELEGGTRRWTDIMSGNWAWKQAVRSRLFTRSVPTLTETLGRYWQGSRHPWCNDGPIALG